MEASRTNSRMARKWENVPDRKHRKDPKIHLFARMVTVSVIHLVKMRLRSHTARARISMTITLPKDLLKILALRSDPSMMKMLPMSPMGMPRKFWMLKRMGTHSGQLIVEVVLLFMSVRAICIL